MVVAVPLLLLELESLVLDVTVAVLLMIEPVGTVGATITFRVKTELPTANEGFEQSMVPGFPAAGVVQDQPPGAEKGATKVVPAGRLSLQDALDAVSGPLFVTVIV